MKVCCQMLWRRVPARCYFPPYRVRARSGRIANQILKQCT